MQQVNLNQQVIMDFIYSEPEMAVSVQTQEIIDRLVMQTGKPVEEVTAAVLEAERETDMQLGETVPDVVTAAILAVEEAGPKTCKAIAKKARVDEALIQNHLFDAVSYIAETMGESFTATLQNLSDAYLTPGQCKGGVI